MRLLLIALVLTGCGGKLKRLSDAEQDHYYALKVWMDEAERKDFLREKTEEQRNAWLEERGLWERFYQHDAATRQAIVAGEVAPGWTEEMVFMAWGPPIQRRRMTSRPAERSELFVYRFEVDDEGVIRVWVPGSRTAYKMVDRFQSELYVDDGVVTEILRKDEWE